MDDLQILLPVLAVVARIVTCVITERDQAPRPVAKSPDSRSARRAVLRTTEEERRRMAGALALADEDKRGSLSVAEADAGLSVVDSTESE
ncbi:MAG: hypothetical protein RIT81_27465 [Deltaproteobacteria bacterium]